MSPQAESSRSNVAGLRTVERLDLECKSSLGQRETTLFANGTIPGVRVVSTERQARCGLRELDIRRASEALLGPARRSSILRKRRSRAYHSVHGEWVDQCRSLDPPAEGGAREVVPSSVSTIQSERSQQQKRMVDLARRDRTSLIDREARIAGSATDRLPLDDSPGFDRRHSGARGRRHAFASPSIT